ncbi:hypothetical protein HPP92_027764 [Vanilla planifolia]|uniref:Uncharacterized protein n=1 Tax=Vanilla planifolia TaxID=51239 RepID=A0A835P9U9_VANPL|nr:hypothetical protein HPP92_027764 [Vanilla planifolia]
MAAVLMVVGSGIPPALQYLRGEDIRIGRRIPWKARIECSSRPKKKATAHHMKTRPKKTQPWDIKRKGPTFYPPLPPLPPEVTIVSAADNQDDAMPSTLQKLQKAEVEDLDPGPLLVSPKA